jgi:HAD superfamily hydrolase (TIGR01509 family)
MAPVVVFDVMDTLLHDPYREAYEAATGMTWDGFAAARPEGAYEALERSEIDESDYWRTVRGAGISVDVRRFHATRRDGYRWLPGMRGLLLETAASHRVILASNYPAAWLDDVRSSFFEGIRVELCGSSVLAARKPSRAFFDRMVQRLGLDPASTVLVDDSASNLAGAVAAGWRAIRFQDAATTRDSLRPLIAREVDVPAAAERRGVTSRERGE